RSPRNEGGALPQLADQPPRERRGHRADHARAGRHGIADLQSWPARDERGLPAQLRSEAQEDDPGGAAGIASASGVEPASERELRRCMRALIARPAARRTSPQKLASRPTP